MKSILSIFALFCLTLSCSKIKDNTANSKTTFKEKFINDTISFIVKPISVPIDIDGDGVYDVSIYIKNEKWQTWSEDSTALIPLVTGVQTPQQTKRVYYSLDSIRCPVTTTDTITFYNSKMCSDTDPKLNKTELKTFVKLDNNDTIVYSDLTKTLLVSYSYYSYTNGPCGQTVIDNYYGNGIGSNNTIQFKKAGKRFNLKLSKKIPNLIVHSITELD